MQRAEEILTFQETKVVYSKETQFLKRFHFWLLVQAHILADREPIGLLLKSKAKGRFSKPSSLKSASTCQSPLHSDLTTVKHRRSAHFEQAAITNIFQTWECSKLYVKRPPPPKHQHQPKIFTLLWRRDHGTASSDEGISRENKWAFSNSIHPDFKALCWPPS